MVFINIQQPISSMLKHNSDRYLDARNKTLAPTWGIESMLHRTTLTHMDIRTIFWDPATSGRSGLLSQSRNLKDKANGCDENILETTLHMESDFFAASVVHTSCQPVNDWPWKENGYMRAI
jgi:hypothetical protein